MINSKDLIYKHDVLINNHNYMEFYNKETGKVIYCHSFGLLSMFYDSRMTLLCCVYTVSFFKDFIR